MDKTSIIGIILGIAAIALAMFFKGIGISALLNPAAFSIIIIGTIATITIGFPTNEIKKIPKLFKILFSDKKMITIQELIPIFVDLANVARREGLLSLERKVMDIDDTFLKNGLNLAIDGLSQDAIRDLMTEELEAMEERHSVGINIFTQAGTYAPTLGVLGAVMGLIAALSNMSDTAELSKAISAAFVATMLGIFTGYVLWYPFANKLRRKSQQEVIVKQIMIEGVLSVVEGQAPTVIARKLASYLPIDERSQFLDEGGKSDEQEKEE